MKFHIVLIFLVAPSSVKASECEGTGLPDGGLSSFTVNEFARLGYQDAEEYHSSCGGTIIEGRFLITAAHCFVSTNVIPAAKLTVVTDSGITFEVGKSVVYPKFKFPSLEDNIAIVELVENGKTLETLQDTTFSSGENLEGKTAIFYGHGFDYNGSLSTKLKKDEVQVISNNDCFEWLSYNTTTKRNLNATFKLQLPNGISENMLCTKGIHDTVKDFYTGPCQGDGGGPLFVVHDNGSKTFEGIISGGISCARNIPHWYTKVSKYASWIQCVIGEFQKKEN